MTGLASLITFKPCQLGRETAHLGDKQVGAVMIINGGSGVRAAGIVTLPDVAQRWHPARSIEQARAIVEREVAAWLEGAGLAPAQRRRA